MCLELETCISKIAQEDIPCYKIVACDIHTEPKKWYTPYYITELSEEQLNGKCPLYSNDIFPDFMFITKDNEVHGGAIHTYKYEFNALDDVKFAYSPSWKTELETHVFRCIIPKGTIYAEGIYGLCQGYASKQIIFKEKIL